MTQTILPSQRLARFLQDDSTTPTIPRRSTERAPAREVSLHRKSKSLPASTPGTPAGTIAEEGEEDPVTPLSPSSEGNLDKASHHCLSCAMVFALVSPHVHAASFGSLQMSKSATR